MEPDELPKHLQDRVDRGIGHEIEEACPPSTKFSFSIGGPPGWLDDKPSLGTYAWGAASFVSTALCAYHGYKRNGTVSDAILWGMLGGAFPGFAPAIALAQGFGRPGPDYEPPKTWKGSPVRSPVRVFVGSVETIVESVDPMKPVL